MPCDFQTRRKTFRGRVLVAQVLFILPERFRLNVSAKMIKLLRPFLNELDR